MPSRSPNRAPSGLLSWGLTTCNPCGVGETGELGEEVEVGGGYGGVGEALGNAFAHSGADGFGIFINFFDGGRHCFGETGRSHSFVVAPGGQEAGGSGG